MQADIQEEEVAAAAELAAARAKVRDLEQQVQRDGLLHAGIGHGLLTTDRLSNFIHR